MTAAPQLKLGRSWRVLRLPRPILLRRCNRLHTRPWRRTHTHSRTHKRCPVDMMHPAPARLRMQLVLQLLPAGMDSGRLSARSVHPEHMPATQGAAIAQQPVRRLLWGLAPITGGGATQSPACGPSRGLNRWQSSCWVHERTEPHRTQQAARHAFQPPVIYIPSLLTALHMTAVA
jgi:hypothetical protein